MSFLYPDFLWALLVLIIPVIIHLLNLQRSKKIYFSNLSFLKEVDQQTKRNFRLKKLLVLLCRILALGFLVIAFAQPFWKLTEKANRDVSKTVFLDNSYSMERKRINLSMLDEGVLYLKEILASKNGTNPLWVLTCNSETRISSNSNGNRVLDNTTFTNTFRSINWVLDELKTKEITSGEQRNELILISDFQKATLGTLERLINDTSILTKIVPVGNREERNLFVDSVWLESPSVNTGETVLINVQIRNLGTKNAQNAKVDLLVDDNLTSTCVKNIVAGGQVICQMDLQMNKAGQAQCRLVVSGDEVYFDNNFFFVITCSSNVRVLILNDHTSSYVYNAISNESTFLSKTLTSSNLSNDFSDVDFLVIENINTLNDGLIEDIVKYVERGGDIMIFPNEQSQDDFEKLIRNLNISSSRIQNIGDTSIPQPDNYIGHPDLNNPFYRGVFTDIKANISMPYVKHLYQIKERGEILLRSKDGYPVLSRNVVGSGRCYFWSMPLDAKYSNINRHSLFVPVLYQAVRGSKNANDRIYYENSSNGLVLSGKFIKDELPYRLKNETGELISNNVLNGDVIFQTKDGDIQSGFYKLIHGEELLGRIAVNITSKESITEFYSTEELQEMFKDVEHITVYDVDSPLELQNALKEADEGVALWKKCLLLSLIFLLIEILLIRFYR